MTAVFVALVVAFGLSLWATVVRPSAYEVRGEIIARPASNLIMVRHEAVSALGMSAMELMAIFSDPRILDDAQVGPGTKVRLAVRRQNDELTLLRLEKLP